MLSHFRIIPSSGEPIYQQLIRQVKFLVGAGRLPDGTRLPSVRALAAELEINPNTVARAYRDLESIGLVETQRGGGTRIKVPKKRLLKEERREKLAPLIDRLLAEAWSLGIEWEELSSYLNERLETFTKEIESND